MHCDTALFSFCFELLADVLRSKISDDSDWSISDVIKESYHRESRVVVDDHQILFSIEFRVISAKLFPCLVWKVWLQDA